MNRTVQRTICPTGNVWAWNDKYECLYALADSEYAGSVAGQIEIPDVGQAEAAIQEVAARLDDKHLLDALDECSCTVKKQATENKR